MNILVVAFYDDNFGDMLIRTCFTSLLQTALQNLAIPETEYNISQMPLKNIQLPQIEQADLIFFAGGGLFGLSYLNFYDYVAQIIEMAEKNQIPVIFSSIGVNNMDATEESEQKLFSLLQNTCIKAISVRENIDLFQKYAENCSFTIQQVCDPAVWAKQVYATQLLKMTAVPVSSSEASKKCIGINVVRGGLFEANTLSWKLKNEVEYLSALKDRLEEMGYDYRFYTNGSLLDENAMRFFAKEKEIPEDKLIFVHSSSDLVRTVSQFDAIAAIRMHSAILAYSFQIPTVNLIWNDKIRHFYNNIGYPDRALSVDQWTADSVAEHLAKFLSEPQIPANSAYQMSLYTFLFDILSQTLQKDKTYRPYTFEQVTDALLKYQPAIEETLIDLRYKIQRGEDHYLARFYDIREKNQQIKTLTKENEKLGKRITKQEQTLEKNKERIEQQKQTITSQKKTIENQKQMMDSQKKYLQQIQEELSEIYSSTLGKIYRKTKGLKPKISKE